MPYVIRKRDDHYDVVNKATEETVSTHATHQKAVRAVRAIYANENRVGKDHRWFK